MHSAWNKQDILYATNCRKNNPTKQFEYMITSEYRKFQDDRLLQIYYSNIVFFPELERMLARCKRMKTWYANGGKLCAKGI